MNNKAEEMIEKANNVKPIKQDVRWLQTVEIETVADKKLDLTIGFVKKFFNPVADFDECLMFLNKCKQYNADPFMNDMYLIKYSSSKPASIVSGVGYFEKRAQLNPKFKGYTQTMFYYDDKWSEFFLPTSTSKTPLACKVGAYVNGYTEAQYQVVTWEESKQSSPMWVKMPSAMLEKVCKVRLLRKLFSADFGGLYTIEELGQEEAAESLTDYQDKQAIDVVALPDGALLDVEEEAKDETEWTEPEGKDEN